MIHLQERLKSLKKECGSAPLGQVLVEQAIGGMRGIPVSRVVPCRWGTRSAHWRKEELGSLVLKHTKPDPSSRV